MIFKFLPNRLYSTLFLFFYFFHFNLLMAIVGLIVRSSSITNILLIFDSDNWDIKRVNCLILILIPLILNLLER